MYYGISILTFKSSAPSTRSPVNPAYESATFWIRSPEWNFFNTLWIRNRVDPKSKYIFTPWRNKIEPSSLPWIFKMAADRNVSLLYFFLLISSLTTCVQLNPRSSEELFVTLIEVKFYIWYRESPLFTVYCGVEYEIDWSNPHAIGLQPSNARWERIDLQ